MSERRTTMKPKVYIDGKEGTTGLQIYDRLASRDDMELLLIDEAKRKDADERKKLINAADITFLCLPDAAAKEAVSFVEKDSARIIDASTAHRTAPGGHMEFRSFPLRIKMQSFTRNLPQIRAVTHRDS